MAKYRAWFGSARSPLTLFAVPAYGFLVRLLRRSGPSAIAGLPERRRQERPCNGSDPVDQLSYPLARKTGRAEGSSGIHCRASQRPADENVEQQHQSDTKARHPRSIRGDCRSEYGRHQEERRTTQSDCRSQRNRLAITGTPSMALRTAAAGRSSLTSNAARQAAAS